MDVGAALCIFQSTLSLHIPPSSAHPAALFMTIHMLHHPRLCALSLFFYRQHSQIRGRAEHLTARCSENSPSNSLFLGTHRDNTLAKFSWHLPSKAAVQNQTRHQNWKSCFIPSLYVCHHITEKENTQ
ncbi:hypothetical protein DQ04_02641100 [Trypanosoma grayi]|uniref:hypothetical protein n=1 Tax=Trypanosoma grayi TaxID=71804 RepID=UPI0004F43B54|nr:hypothetical protein DQ04_02641100 [Trypanosoma grayi]KEG11423.1 hypothetical protein DQ04_02641100 [Trypanosoma grayi]